MTQLYGFPHAPKSTIQMTAKTLGTLGELTVGARIERYGFEVQHQPGARLGDMLVTYPVIGQRSIEIKTSFVGKDGRYQFCLYRQLKGRVCTDHRHADFVILLCVDGNYHTVALMIPSAVLTGKHVSFKNPLTCKYRQYIQWQ